MLTKDFVRLGTAALAVATMTQAPAAQAQPEPVAYVYVSSTPANSKVSNIVAYAAAPSGKLTAVPGSPFPDAVGSMAVNGLFLLGASQTGPDINTYRIEPDGGLTFVSSNDYAKYNNPGGIECGVAGNIYFDHTGADLYVQEFNGSNACTNTVVSSFGVNKYTGDLNYLGTAVTGEFPGDWTEAFFTGNNVYAYTANNDACMYYTIYGFKRETNGLLNLIPANYNLPAPPPSFTRYIPYMAAADPTNHVAFVMYPGNPPGCTSAPLQIASYTADASGNLTTTNTYTNMPKTLIQNLNYLQMSPSGRLLAVAGQEGLQIFRFNGANPIGYYTGLITTDPINQMFWDNHNHLYAISQSTGRLHVFTITPWGYSEAPRSPYAVSNPQSIIVQPWPLPWM